MNKKSLLLLVLTLAVLAVPVGVKRVYAVPVQNFRVLAAFSGWNVTTGGTVNPTVTEFKGVQFTVTVEFDDTPGISHNFAIYTKGTTAGSVSTAQTCSPPGTSGCWARSATVNTSSLTATVSFTPTVPADDFTGAGGYEYYCQFHPSTMHGKITVYKNIDTNNDHAVNILDIATVAFYFGQSNPTWAPGAIPVDFNNDGAVTILDVALSAFYFGKSFV